MIVATVFLTFGCLKVVDEVVTTHQTLVAANKDMSLLPSHFILMGMNKETKGGFSGSDYAYSTSFKNHQQQNKGNWKLIRQRLNKFGVAGYIKFLFTKNYYNSSDGTLGWSNDNQFSEPSLTKYRFIRSFFFQYGSRQSFYFVVSQLVWILILVGVLLSFFDRSLFARVLRLSVLGLLTFLLFFEGGRSRYLIQGLPMIYMLSIIGWYRLVDWSKTQSVITWSRGSIWQLLGEGNKL